MKKIPLLFLVFCIAFVTSGHGAQTAAGLKDIPLEWKPSDAVSSYGAIDLTAYQNAQFVIRPFTDARKQPPEIGISTEKRFSDRDMVVTTNQNVADWLTDNVAKVFPQFGINVVTGNGTFFVDADVVKFFVTESSRYNAEVSLKVKVTGKNGAVVWQGMTAGTASFLGRSFKAYNYSEALSNATISAVHGLLNDDSFKQAVLKNK
jgi:hypothetical protein